MHFVQASSDVDRWQDLSVLQSIHVELPEPMWDEAHTYETTPRMDGKPQANAQFADLPSELAQEKNDTAWKKELKDHLYRTERYCLQRCEVLKAYSKPGETEAVFRIRMIQQARESRDVAKEKVRSKFKKRLERAQAA